jgi:hypothetical protein
MIIRDDSPREPDPQRFGEDPPQPVEGEVIRLAAGGAALRLLGIVAAVAWGVFLLLLLALKALLALGAGAPEDGELGALVLLGVCAGFAVPVFAYLLVRKLQAGRRIVIGADRVQIVEGRGADVRVLVSIPYENIEALEQTRVDFGYRVDFELEDTHDPQTYLPGADVEANFLTHGYHYAITETCQKTPEQIFRRLWRARDRVRKDSDTGTR